MKKQIRYSKPKKKRLLVNKDGKLTPTKRMKKLMRFK